MKSPFLVIMGVSGCGKSTVARMLAQDIGGTYLEGDSFHPPENKAKMGAGIPLTDEDRWPWFERLRDAAQKVISENSVPVLACSALKASYRDYLLQGFECPRLVFLEGSFDLIKSRMDSRDHEYMTSDLLKSQFETLEPPSPSRECLVLSIQDSPEKIVEKIAVWLPVENASNG